MVSVLNRQRTVCLTNNRYIYFYCTQTPLRVYELILSMATKNNTAQATAALFNGNKNICMQLSLVGVVNRAHLTTAAVKLQLNRDECQTTWHKSQHLNVRCKNLCFYEVVNELFVFSAIFYALSIASCLLIFTTYCHCWCIYTMCLQLQFYCCYVSKLNIVTKHMLYSWAVTSVDFLQ